MAKPETLSNILGKDRGLGLVRDMVTLEKNWPQLVGDFLAPHTWPVSLKNGLLTVGVSNPVIAQELSRMATTLDDCGADDRSEESGSEDGLPSVMSGLIKKVNGLLGKESVTETRFKTTAKPRTVKQQPDKSKAQRSRVRPVKKLDSAEMARVKAKLSGIADPELREIMLRLRQKLHH